VSRRRRISWPHFRWMPSPSRWTQPPLPSAFIVTSKGSRKLLGSLARPPQQPRVSASLDPTCVVLAR
jgi:hypothetical protein